MELSGSLHGQLLIGRRYCLYGLLTPHSTEIQIYVCKRLDIVICHLCHACTRPNKGRIEDGEGEGGREGGRERGREGGRERERERGSEGGRVELN